MTVRRHKWSSDVVVKTLANGVQCIITQTAVSWTCDSFFRRRAPLRKPTGSFVAETAVQQIFSSFADLDLRCGGSLDRQYCFTLNDEYCCSDIDFEIWFRQLVAEKRLLFLGWHSVKVSSILSLHFMHVYWTVPAWWLSWQSPCFL